MDDTALTVSDDEPVDKRCKVTPAMRREIQQAHLDGETNTAIAKRLKLNRVTVSRQLQGPDYDKLLVQHQAKVKKRALDALKNNADEAVEMWRQSWGPAVKKGQHKPMEDYLKAGGIIEDSKEPSIVVQIGVKLTGGPE